MGRRGAVDEDMVRLYRSLGRASLDSALDDVENMGFLVAEHIPLDSWNRFAQLDELPRGLKLRQLVWDDDKVWVVEYPMGAPHEMATWYIGTSFPRRCHHTGQAEITGLDSNVPQGVNGDQWVTVIVEVLHRQEWESVYPKVEMYRQLPGVQYIFCVKMSDQLNVLSYEFYDVGNAPNPAFLNRAVRHSFDVGTVDQPHVVVFDSRRVLGLPANAELPTRQQDTIEVDVVALARDVRDD